MVFPLHQDQNDLASRSARPHLPTLDDEPPHCDIEVFAGQAWALLDDRPSRLMILLLIVVSIPEKTSVLGRAGAGRRKGSGFVRHGRHGVHA